MEGVLSVFTAFGLSSAAGLNAYLPLLVVALLARFTDLITLSAPWDTLESWPVIGVLVVLLIIEIVVDKVPAVDTVNDIIQTVVRPIAGAILFASSTGAVSEADPVFAMICGLLVAGSVHAAKATVRPVITASTAGTMNPVVSSVEDVASFTISVIAILMPVLGIILLGLLIFWFVRLWRRRRRQRAQPA